MIKSTNHLASPSLLIKCAGLLAPDQLERLQEQQGQEQTGGLFHFGFYVFSWFYNAGSLSRFLQVLSVINKAERGLLSFSGIHD